MTHSELQGARGCPAAGQLSERRSGLGPICRLLLLLLLLLLVCFLLLLLLLLAGCCSGGAVAQRLAAALLLLLRLLRLLRGRALGALRLLLPGRGVDLESKHLGHILVCGEKMGCRGGGQAGSGGQQARGRSAAPSARSTAQLPQPGAAPRLLHTARASWLPPQAHPRAWAASAAGRSAGTGAQT